MKKFLTFILAVTTILALYVVWIKWHVSCISCASTTFGLPFDQLTLSKLALFAVVLISIIYYFSHGINRLKYVSIGVSGICATVASFLMAFQIRHSICSPCFTTDIMFCVIFFLICLEDSCGLKQDEIGGIEND